MAAGGYLQKWISRQNSAEGGLILTKWGIPGYQNDTLMTNLRSKSKLKVEFQYGDRPFPEAGSSFISVVDWDISSKFGSQINFHRFKQVQTLNIRPLSRRILPPPRAKMCRDAAAGKNLACRRASRNFRAPPPPHFSGRATALVN